MHTMHLFKAIRAITNDLIQLTIFVSTSNIASLVQISGMVAQVARIDIQFNVILVLDMQAFDTSTQNNVERRPVTAMHVQNNK